MWPDDGLGWQLHCRTNFKRTFLLCESNETRPENYDGGRGRGGYGGIAR